MAPRSILENKNSKSKPGSHIPNLKTIEMIEEVLAKEKEFSSRNKLSRALPKQVQQQTIEVVLEYLERSKKIMREGGAILWIFGDNNPKLMKLHKMSTELK
ncbi:hypothetical protein [Candidatus Nitrosotenuis chungbukensis]|uniref:hypothetical protein n=2 Tax=Candidatus Nitrosotenuis chungbukensis TaxID=1353246 RepID=UPI0005B29397|nr:hypothetical protein [Candidatus Nitrosotenuis chungbukensis]